MTLDSYMQELGRAARTASRRLAASTTAERNGALKAIAEAKRPLLRRLRHHIAVDQIFRFLFGQSANAVGFLFGLGDGPFLLAER
mgnify:CR=1 FL=1